MRVGDFLRSGHKPTLLLAFLYFDVSFMVWVLVGALGVFIAEEFGLTPAQKGLMAAVPILGGALLRVPMGILVDRVGPRRAGILGQIAVLAPLAWGWLGVARWGEVLALGLLLGVAGSSFAVALPLAGRWYPPRHQGLAMGIAGAGNSGTVVAALLAPRLAESWGWRAVFGGALLPALVVLVLFVLWAREAPGRPAPRPLRAYVDLWRKRDTLGFSLLYAVTFGGFVGLASFLVVFFHDQYGMGRIAAGNLAALCVFAGSFMRPVGGFLADRWGGLRVLVLVLTGASLGLGAAGLGPPAAGAAALLVGALACLGLGNGAVFQLVPQRFREDLGAATGMIGAAGGLGGFLVPNVLGLCRELTGAYAAGFFVLSLAGAYGVALLGWQRERWGRSKVEPGAHPPEPSALRPAEAGSRG
jgi:NNP family nitrate/nitrite transporter-like MFS transporter